MIKSKILKQFKIIVACICELSVIYSNIAKWGELSSESWANCLMARFSWGMLSWVELSLGRIVLIPERSWDSCILPDRKRSGLTIINVGMYPWTT